MRILTALILVLVAPALAWAQNPDEFSPPPLLPAQPDATPPPSAPNPATPPPPGATPPPPGSAAPTGYPYSPYGQPLVPPEQPPAEIGLMISEVAFGALTAAGVSLLPFLLLQPMLVSDSTGMGDLLLVLIFSAVPLAVSQTELSLANGSRYYYTESWPPALAGLAAQGLVLGLFYWMGGLNATLLQPGLRTFLLAGTIGLVPIAEMVAINLAKTPRHKLPYGGFGALDYRPHRGWSVRAPAISPFVGDGRAGRALGVHVGLVGGAF